MTGRFDFLAANLTLESRRAQESSFPGDVAFYVAWAMGRTPLTVLYGAIQRQLARRRRIVQLAQHLLIEHQ